MGNRASIGIDLRLSLDTPAEVIDILQSVADMTEQTYDCKTMWEMEGVRYLLTKIRFYSTRGYKAPWDRCKFTRTENEYRFLSESMTKTDEIELEELFQMLGPFLLKGTRGVIIYESDNLNYRVYEVICNREIPMMTDIHASQGILNDHGQCWLDCLDWMPSVVWKYFNQLKGMNKDIRTMVHLKVYHESLMHYKNEWWCRN